jgi:hypothetical protein
MSFFKKHNSEYFLNSLKELADALAKNQPIKGNISRRGIAGS